MSNSIPDEATSQQPQKTQEKLRLHRLLLAAPTNKDLNVTSSNLDTKSPFFAKSTQPEKTLPFPLNLPTAPMNKNYQTSNAISGGVMREDSSTGALHGMSSLDNCFPDSVIFKELLSRGCDLKTFNSSSPEKSMQQYLHQSSTNYSNLLSLETHSAVLNDAAQSVPIVLTGELPILRNSLPTSKPITNLSTKQYVNATGLRNFSPTKRVVNTKKGNNFLRPCNDAQDRAQDSMTVYTLHDKNIAKIEPITSTQKILLVPVSSSSQSTQANPVVDSAFSAITSNAVFCPDFGKPIVYGTPAACDSEKFKARPPSHLNYPSGQVVQIGNSMFMLTPILSDVDKALLHYQRQQQINKTEFDNQREMYDPEKVSTPAQSFKQKTTGMTYKKAVKSIRKNWLKSRRIVNKLQSKQTSGNTQSEQMRKSTEASLLEQEGQNSGLIPNVQPIRAEAVTPSDNPPPTPQDVHSKQNEQISKDTQPPARVVQLTPHGQIAEIVETEEYFELPGVYYNGYNYYTKNRKECCLENLETDKDKIIRFSCIKYSCPAKISVVNLDIDTIKTYGTHTCDKNTHETLEHKLFRELCIDAATESPADTKPQSIFDDIREHYPDLAHGSELRSVSKTIQRALKSSIIRTDIKHKYSSLKEFGEHLKEKPSILTFKDKKGLSFELSSELIQSSSQSYHVIFYDKELIEKFDHGNSIFIDSTFKVKPDIKGASQFMTIMAKIFNVVVPIAWVLMSKRTSRAYNEVWKFFHKNFPSFQPLRAHCDYEKASIKSLRTSFPGIVIKGCWFHYVQAIVRKAKSKEYRLYEKENSKKIRWDMKLSEKWHIWLCCQRIKLKEGLKLLTS